MTEHKELAPSVKRVSKVTKAELLQELKSLVNNDPNTPYLARRKMSLALKVRQFISVGGHFPSSVAYYALAIGGSVFILCSGYSEDSSHIFVWVFMGSALAAQIIEATIGKG